MRKRGNKAQMKLSFGMIFSIILIAVFISFAIYVIVLLLEGQKKDMVALFVNDLRNDIDDVWKSSQSSQEITYNLPNDVEYVCFVDYDSKAKGKNEAFYSKLKQVYYGDENLFLYPVGSGQGLDSFMINHIDTEKIIERENPFCIENQKGVKITLKKDFGEALVYFER